MDEIRKRVLASKNRNRARRDGTRVQGESGVGALWGLQRSRTKDGGLEKEEGKRGKAPRVHDKDGGGKLESHVVAIEGGIEVGDGVIKSRG